MAKTSEGHLDKRTVERLGYFQKKEDGMPHPNYRTECESGGRGYLGPRNEAHHILPQTSIEESVQDSGKDQRYISDVQYITDWNINKPDNMIGLPTYATYALYYQQKTRLVDLVGTGDTASWISAYNRQFQTSTRRRWADEVINVSPENHPIHNPVNWGHTAYNAEVKQEVKRHVWDKINDKKKNHELDAETVAAALDSVAEMNYDYLVDRGQGANKAKWDRRIDPDDDGWYEPFTMYDVPNPIFG